MCLAYAKEELLGCAHGVLARDCLPVNRAEIQHCSVGAVLFHHAENRRVVGRACSFNDAESKPVGNVGADGVRMLCWEGELLSEDRLLCVQGNDVLNGRCAAEVIRGERDAVTEFP